MKMPYRDKNRISSEYRAVLMGRTVGLVMLTVILIASAFPGLNTTVFSCICTLIIIPALLYQICADRTLIHTGQFLMENGDDLYIVVKTFRLGFGRNYHRREKAISASALEEKSSSGSPAKRARRPPATDYSPHIRYTARSVTISRGSFLWSAVYCPGKSLHCCGVCKIFKQRYKTYNKRR